MARTTTKEVYVNISGKKAIENFIELLSDALTYIEFTLTYKEGVMKVRLYGEKEVVNQSVITVKSYGRMFSQSTTPNKNGCYIHNLKLIQQIGSKIISLEIINEVLVRSGVHSEVEGQDLITSATMYEVQQVLEELHNLIQEIPLTVRTQTMKRVLTTVSYCTGLNPSFIIEKGLELDYFKINQNMISVNYHPKKCIEDLIELMSEGNVQSEYDDFVKKEETDNQMFLKK